MRGVMEWAVDVGISIRNRIKHNEARGTTKKQYGAFASWLYYSFLDRGLKTSISGNPRNAQIEIKDEGLSKLCTDLEVEASWGVGCPSGEKRSCPIVSVSGGMVKLYSINSDGSIASRSPYKRVLGKAKSYKAVLWA